VGRVFLLAHHAYHVYDNIRGAVFCVPSPSQTLPKLMTMSETLSGRTIFIVMESGRTTLGLVVS
jgi:hypothetical protein